jgi:hypothetical protein
MKAHEYRMNKELNHMRSDMAQHLANLEHRLDSYLNGMQGASGREADREVAGQGGELTRGQGGQVPTRPMPTPAHHVSGDMEEVACTGSGWQSAAQTPTPHTSQPVLAHALRQSEDSESSLGARSCASSVLNSVSKAESEDDNAGNAANAASEAMPRQLLARSPKHEASRSPTLGSLPLLPRLALKRFVYLPSPPSCLRSLPSSTHLHPALTS